MTDSHLRELERRFRLTGTVEDEGAWLRGRLQVGALTQDHLALAARLRHLAAVRLLPDAKPVKWSNVNAVEGAVRVATALLGDETLGARIAADWAEHVLPLFEDRFPGDSMPREAIAAVRAWAACPCDEHLAAADAASAAATARFGHGLNEVAATDSAAMHAAHASCIAVAAVYRPYASPAPARYAASAGHRAVRAAADAARAAGSDSARALEGEWQRLRLAAYVLGEAVAGSGGSSGPR